MKKITLILYFLSLIANTSTAQLLGKLLSPSKQKQVNALPSQGITGVNHEKYANQLVFDTTTITYENMNNPNLQFKTKFYTNQTIVGRMFLSKPIVSYLLKNGQVNGGINGSFCDVTVKYSIDGGESQLLTIYRDINSKDNNNKYLTTIRFEFIDYSKNSDQLPGIKLKMSEMLSSLSEGEHQIKVDVYGGIETNGGTTETRTKDPLASGIFTFIKSGASKIGRNFEEIKEHSSADNATRDKILKMIQETSTNSGWKEKITRVKITSDWEVERNNLGVIIKKKKGFYAYAVWPDGHCSFQFFSADQEYLGGGNYSETLKVGSVGDQKKCDCSK